MTNTPMTFEEWAEENMHAIDDMVYAKQIWQASQAQQASEIEALKHDLYSYMEASNEYCNEIMEQAQTIAELVEALEVLSDFAGSVGGSSSFWDEVWPAHDERIEAAIAKVKGK